MTREKTLGQIAFETQFHPTAWLEISDFHKKAWEEQASAIRAEVIEECAKALKDFDANASDPSEYLRSLKDQPE
jgi:hypothetical protein